MSVEPVLAKSNALNKSIISIRMISFTSRATSPKVSKTSTNVLALATTKKLPMSISITLVITFRT